MYRICNVIICQCSGSEFAKPASYAILFVDMFLADKWVQLVSWIQEKIPSERRRRVIMIAAGSAVILWLVITGISLIAKNGSGRESAPAADNTAAKPGIIPNEELYLPDEPDFLPHVMLTREQRTEWNVDDTAPWWQDPLKNGEERWRNFIEINVDNILENVP